MCGADISGVGMRGADIRGLDMRGASIRGVGIRGADMSGVGMRGADRKGKLPGAPAAAARAEAAPRATAGGAGQTTIGAGCLGSAGLVGGGAMVIQVPGRGASRKPLGGPRSSPAWRSGSVWAPNPARARDSMREGFCVLERLPRSRQRPPTCVRPGRVLCASDGDPLEGGCCRRRSSVRCGPSRRAADNAALALACLRHGVPRRGLDAVVQRSTVRQFADERPFDYGHRICR
jgi:hypothetical protein